MLLVYESKVEIEKFNMADSIYKKMVDELENLYLAVF